MADKVRSAAYIIACVGVILEHYLDPRAPATLHHPTPVPQVAPSYAPPGQTLVSASTVGTLDELSDAALEAEVRRQLGGWFGAGQVQAWKLIRIYRIPFAQPNQV